jgi:hypothetical protein
LCPAIKSFVASNEPYEAPRIRMLRAICPPKTIQIRQLAVRPAVAFE